MATRPITRGCTSWAASYSSSAAREFLQLAPRRSYYRASAPLLDFLVPGVPSKAILHGSSTPACLKSQIAGKRAFTTSSVRRITSAVFNPRKDDDGKEMSVEITPRAASVCTPSPIPNPHAHMNLAFERYHGYRFKPQPRSANPG